MEWSHEHDEVLRDNWGNISAASIGDLIGRTRNMVIGRARRLGLKLLRKPAQRKRKPQERPQERKAGIEMIEPVQEVLLEPPSLAVSILNLGPLQCSYIEGDDRLCCGHPTVHGKRWCAFHYRVVYRPIDERQRARSSLNQAAE